MDEDSFYPAEILPNQLEWKERSAFTLTLDLQVQIRLFY